jgi:hypothetical protein
MAARVATLCPLMRRLPNLTRRTARRLPWRPGAVVLLALLLAGCSTGGPANTGLTDPAQSVSPVPDYPDTCAPVGVDTTSPCLRITLEAIDAARAAENLPPMELPADFPRLSVPEQLFVAIDRERVDRGLAPFAGLTSALDADAQKGAAAARLPTRPGPAFSSVNAEWIGDVDNGLDADFEWLYNDGPDSGVPGCSGGTTSGCWADRQIVLNRFGTRHLVMGAAYDPTGDRSSEDRGGSSLAATLATSSRAGPYAYTWTQAQRAMAAGTLQPMRAIPPSESDTGIEDPAHNVAPMPDYTRVCAAAGIDDSPACLGAVLDAINHAHALEGIHPMVLPADFAQLSIPDQLFVAVNLERVDRGLPAFGGLTTALNQNAQRGADDANDPPDPGPSYDLDDAEWAGGSSNGLDAVYGWMYDDGFDSGNLDCLRRGAAGCWGHRKGILDDFGSGPHLVMGAAIDVSGDTHRGDNQGTSMAVTLAVASTPVHTFTYSWAQAAALSAGAT